MTREQLQQIKQQYLRRIEEIDYEIAHYGERTLSEEEQASLNAFEAIVNDGIKLIANVGNPMLVTFPMEVIPNMFYRIPDSDREWVCYKRGIVTADNYEEYLDGGI